MGIPLSRRWFAAAAFCAATAAIARSSRCDVCGKQLSRQAWIYGDKTLCSQECGNQLRPKCSVCKKTIREKYTKAEGRIFCSTACFHTTLPKCEICKKPVETGFTITRHHYCEECVKKQPTCFSCGLPAAHPTRLKDGREICIGCMRWAVTTQEVAQKHYDRARRQLEAWTSLKHASVPELVLVDRTKMDELSNTIRKSDSPVSVRGLYSRQTTVAKRGLFGIWKKAPEPDREKIYLVDHLTDEVFRVAATHELMHDLIHEHFPRLEKAPPWVHEGICQQAAAELCRRRNYVDTLYHIEECTDPDYGDGFRYLKKVSGFQGWPALRRWMETVDVDALPEAAPK
ncbi:MAG: hypothetical protein KAU94_08215 [Verrucomicrobia bacterium]|nr:hypothetical protein [Verrucomicrobiota bacterium]